ncbi:MAG: hypothetical protein ABI781_20750 [Burkholderiales bacterium]
MDFDTFIGKAWDDHVNVAREVADRLDQGVALVADEPQLNRLMHLGQHVYGEHLAAWHEGVAFLERLKTLPTFAPDGASGQQLRRYVAGLQLAADDGAVLDGLSASDRTRVAAIAASNLAAHDTVRASRLLQEALDLAQRSGLPDGDPMNRSLAITSNTLAGALEEKVDRSADERALMILAAQTARHYWAIAGTWLETERAEYRLANTWLQAGDLARAREHAQACLEIVAANDGAALERLFGWEALGLVERAAGNTTGHAQALAHAREAFAELDESDKSWCAASIDKLAAA